MRLTPHFDSREFACHDGTPVPADELGSVRRLCQELLEPLRAQFGPVTVVSGYRTRAYNRAVGGAAQSYHVYDDRPRGAAADIRCRRGGPGAWYAAADRLGAGGLGLYDAHVHVDTRPGRARWREAAP